MKVATANQLAKSISLLLVIGLLGCSEQPETTGKQSQEIAAEPVQKDELITESDLIAESETDAPELISEQNDENLQEAVEPVDPSIETMLSELNESENTLSEDTLAESTPSESITENRQQLRERKRMGRQEEEAESPVSEDITEIQPLTAKEEEQQIEALEDLSEVVEASPELIRKVQQALADAGFNPGTIDGINGPRTMSALNNFQKQNNLAMGQLTKETLQKLEVPY